VLPYLFEFGLGLRHVCGVVRLEVLCGCTVDRLRVCVVGYRAGVVCLTVRFVGYWLSQCEVQVEGLKGAAGLPRSHDSVAFTQPAFPFL
jgi:hypothetical protein